MLGDIEKKVVSVKTYFQNLQDEICAAFENEEDGTRFQETLWEKPAGGGGRTRLLTEGNIIEQGGVNFSHVHGSQLPRVATQKHPELSGHHFQAQGISLVIHPRNPYIPTVHANFRFFIAEKENLEAVWWFGGGYDLTPYYGFDEDCYHWHKIAKAACDPFGKDVYFQLKKECDRYFYLNHRKEGRGIGGLFFDDLTEGGFEHTFAFVQSVGNSFLSAYLPIMQKRKNHSYGEREREFQLRRRGRYVEFNLLYDRGTRFGLEFGGRVESILMSLPPIATWRKGEHHPNLVEDEAHLAKYLVPRDWINNDIPLL